MTYLLALQKAIAETDNLGPCWPEGDKYFTGWYDAGEDLRYSMTLSEQACREHIEHWITDPETVLAEDRGYLERILKINELVGSYK